MTEWLLVWLDDPLCSGLGSRTRAALTK